MDKGYVVIKEAFSKEKAADWTKMVWIRLGMDPNDVSTWNKEKVHMPNHRTAALQEFAPKVWEAMTELLGGEDRIDPKSAVWNDSFIVNLGTEALSGPDVHIDPKDLDNWHVDGDFFVHFLDSPEQALLVIPLFSDIEPRGGGTFISPDGIDMIAKYLAEHPEGVLPTGLSLTPSTSPYANENHHLDPHYWSHLEKIRECKIFDEMTGNIGDVVLMHPLMMHSASKNLTRKQRIITNPPVSLKEPFCFNRPNKDDYSLVELKTLKALGVDSLDFHPTTERRRVVPKRLAMQNKIMEDEKKRLAEYNARLQQENPAKSVSVS
ncbi:hypothetical protein SISSUDRAFT_16157 [Sistotremastrum suecicum HHB10207 ss-3]|uniref:Phytanoyl-CoA dioxygenase n=1 Tax=Sistotremastrum suecicum HHB10207 ss-3 TaxID=1314776 RepID=A0A166J6J6_9AGAM|nr:hypothetical protein SISSUDRAFT_16157 [Sistotremastrum suecicum HHB10207 ss-3]